MFEFHDLLIVNLIIVNLVEKFTKNGNIEIETTDGQP